ncbi:DUF3784 domain-containing protein [Mongoliitalea lutea]|uniref:DUF3784 domain-containing protein n=1 Tax=Mongoliitalea lutea TaxID=849756 RepID=A0A8J3G589_9BACT|nr:DUF3784 domain-containing protein [Mongoliitalea lutea]GHB34494.1 hypothetical protein GCM10008106_14860 [Mongoliitalea lutea]
MTTLIGITLISFGFFVKAFPKLISGYNTMSKRQQENIDIEGLSTFMRNTFLAMGFMVVVGHILLKAVNQPTLSDYFAPLVIAIGAIIMVVKGRQFDHNQEKFVNSKFKVLFTALILIGALLSVIYGIIPSKHEMKHESVAFSGSYGTELKFSEIDSIALTDRIPRVLSRNNGLGVGQIKKGTFRVEDIGKAHLLVHASSGPFLVIITKSGETTIINYKDKAKTDQIYKELQSKI